MRYSILLTGCIAVMFAASSPAQDQLGIAGSTYAPVNTVWNNPSSIADSRAFADIQLAGFGVYARNNLVYLPGGSFSFRNLMDIQEPSFRRVRSSYHAFANIQVWGPSATFAIKQHAFGIHTRFRTIADVRGLPESLGYYLTEGFQYREQMGVQHQVRDARIGALSTAEIGVSYATIISRRGAMITQAGIHVRRVTGIMGAGLRVDDWTYTVLDSTNMRTSRFRGEYGFNDPGFDNFNWRNGGGWGVDLGITFKQRLRDSEGYVPHSPCTDGDYRYRLAFSVLDLGRVRFRGPFYRNLFNETEQKDWNDFSNTQVTDPASLDALFNEGLGAARDNSDQEKLVMMLPAAFSAQFDYNLNHGFYIHTALTAGVPWKNRLGVQRASYLAAVPRWEVKRFAVAVPVSLYEYRYPQVGAMLRINSIVVGSDNLGAFVFRGPVYGADIYVSLKYTLFRHWKCDPREKKPRTKKSLPPGVIPCPSW